jgi:ankyrin repeat protein
LESRALENKPDWFSNLEKDINKSFRAVSAVKDSVDEGDLEERFYQMDDFEFKVMCNRLLQLSNNSKTLIPNLFKLRLIKEAEKKHKIPSNTDLVYITSVHSPKTIWSNQLLITKKNGSVEISTDDGKIPESYEMILSSEHISKISPGQIILKKEDGDGDGDKVFAYYLNDNQGISHVELSATQARAKADILSLNLIITKSDLDSMLSNLTKTEEFKPVKNYIAKQKESGKNSILVLTNDPEFIPVKGQIKVSYNEEQNKLSYTYPVKIDGTNELYSISIDVVNEELSGKLTNMISKTPPMIEIIDTGKVVVRYKENDEELFSEISQGDDFLPILPEDDNERAAKAEALLVKSGLSAGLLAKFSRVIPLDDSRNNNAPAAAPPGSVVNTARQIIRSSGGVANRWHDAAASNNPYIALNSLPDDVFWMTAINRQGKSVFHLLFGNNKCQNMDSIINAVNLLNEKFLPDAEPSLQNFLNLRDGDGNTALHLLCKNENIKGDELGQLLVLLRRNGADLSARDAVGQTALHILCSRGESFEAVQYLSNRIDINAQDSQGFSPLYKALLCHQQEIVGYLIAKGANKDLVQHGNSHLPQTVQEYINSYITHGTDKELREALQARLELYNKLKDSIVIGDIEKIRNEILSNKEIVYDRDVSGNNLLHFAAANNNQDIVKLLINNGCNAFLSNNEGNSPIDLAENKEMVALLLENSEDIKTYRATYEEEIKNSNKSYRAGASAAIATGLFSALSLKNVPENIGSSLMAAGTILTAAVVSGAAFWGAGRFGYECWHQYKDGADANISDAYFLPSNFAKSWKELQELETAADINGDGIAYLKDLEKEIVAETKKHSPDIMVMGENLLKADLLRKSLFKNIEDKAPLLTKSEELITHFNKWKEVQKGRDVSEGLKLFYGAVKNLSAAAAVGTAASLVTDNLPVISAAAIAGGTTTWASKVTSSTKAGERKI